MRITGGAWASRRVASPGPGRAIRPTPDFLREQAFAVLAPGLPGASFLDLYAGTGVNTLEALSRGAGRAVLVERNGAAASLAARNLEAFGTGDRVRLVRGDVRGALARLAAAGEGFDVVWCDPPFGVWGEGVASLERAATLGLFRPDVRVVLEVPEKSTVTVAGLEVVRSFRGAVLLGPEPPPP